MPGIAAGYIVTRPGGIMASEDNFVIDIVGRGTHAARPHMGVGPIVMGAAIVLALQAIVVRRIDPMEPAVVSATEFITHGIRNAIPAHVSSARWLHPRIFTNGQSVRAGESVVAAALKVVGAEFSRRWCATGRPRPPLSIKRE